LLELADQLLQLAFGLSVLDEKLANNIPVPLVQGLGRFQVDAPVQLLHVLEQLVFLALQHGRDTRQDIGPALSQQCNECAARALFRGPESGLQVLRVLLERVEFAQDPDPLWKQVEPLCRQEALAHVVVDMFLTQTIQDCQGQDKRTIARAILFDALILFRHFLLKLGKVLKSIKRLRTDT
jgi:hypothetical protein